MPTTTSAVAATCRPTNGPTAHAHCQAVLLRASETVPVADGQLALGKWQRVLFIDCDGGQRRQVSVTCIGVGGDPQAATSWHSPA